MQIQTSDPQEIYTLKAKDALYKKLYTLKGNPTDISIWREGEYATVSMRPQSKEKGITFHTILQFGAELENAGFELVAYWVGPKVGPGTYEGFDIQISGKDLTVETPEEPEEPIGAYRGTDYEEEKEESASIE